MRKPKKTGEILQNVHILEMAAEGKCVAKHNDKVIFVDHAAPGDIADLRVTKSKSNFSEATPIHFSFYSEQRAQPFCEHFGTCGGCKWQHIQYDTQLFFKAKQVRDALERIAKVPIPEILPILGSEEKTFYRNKMEYTFSNKRWLTSNELSSTETLAKDALGFHIPGRFDKILNIENCYLQPFPSNGIRLSLRAFAIEKNIPFFDLMAQTGTLRNLIIRTSTLGHVMVIVQFFQNNSESIELVMNHLAQSFPEITSLLYIVNEKKNETYQDQEVITYKGDSFILEQMGNLRFKIGAKSFYQTNPVQAEVLYQVAARMAAFKGDEIVFDLYTGTGTIANYIAGKCAKVIGLEYVSEAIEDAKDNSLLNGIRNTSFFAGDIKDLLSKEFIRIHGKPDVIITDPPRAGMHEDVVRMLIEAAPDKIVYVSCNPATQARDIAILDVGYSVEEVQPVDMFPHTHHVENVILLKRKN